MVDNDYDSDPENIEDNSYGRRSFEQRFPRPNSARMMQHQNRFPNAFMMRPMMRPQFNNFNMLNRQDMFSPQVMMYGPDKKKRFDENNFRSNSQKEYINQSEIGHSNRVFPERDIRERPQFQNRFQSPKSNQQHFPTQSGAIRPSIQSNRLPVALPTTAIKSSDPNEHKFLSGEEEEEAFDSSNSLANKVDVNKKTENKENNDDCQSTPTERVALLPKPNDSPIIDHSTSTEDLANLDKQVNELNDYISIERKNSLSLERKDGSSFERRDCPTLDTNTASSHQPIVPTFDRPNVQTPFNKPILQPAFNKPIVPPSFSRSDIPPTDRSNAPQPFSRSNAPQPYDRPIVPSFVRQNENQSFERSNSQQPFERSSMRHSGSPMFNRPNGPRMDHQSFERNDGPHQGHSSMFQRSNVPRHERPLMYERPNLARQEHPSAYERPNFPHQQLNERPNLPRQEGLIERPNLPRSDHSHMHDRSNIPHQEFSHMFERPNLPQQERPLMFERTTMGRQDHPPMFERPQGIRQDNPTMHDRSNVPLTPGSTAIFDRPNHMNINQAAPIHHLARPPHFPEGRLPPPIFAGMHAQPPLSHQQSHNSTKVSTSNNYNMPPTPGMIPIHFQSVPNMPPMHHMGNMPPFPGPRPDFFDPRLRGMLRPPDRPLMPGERPMMPPGFPLPGQFGHPFGHLPPHMVQAPPLPTQAEPSANTSLNLSVLNEEDVWVQNPTTDGRIYYYNWKTRQTNWEKPQGVKIITQTELNILLASKTNQTGAPLIGSAVPVKPIEVAEWNEYRAPDGRAYYHNKRTAVTTWEKPKVISDWESGAVDDKVQVEVTKAEDVIIIEEKIIEEFPIITKDESSDDSNDDAEAEEEKPKGRDKAKPVSSTPISGTPWCIVWTGDGRVFFFNPAKRTSVWERPEELRDRADVDKILDDESKEVTEKDTKMDESEEPPMKKVKVEEKDSSDISEELDEAKQCEIIDPPTKEAVVPNKESAKEAEERAARERALLPLETRMAQFREMLVEKQVSAFSSWEKELHKIVFDTRYLLLASRERKMAFETYVKDRAEEERREKKTHGREKKSQNREKKDQFKGLLKEANLSTKSTFSDFSDKYSLEDRFLCVEKSRDRESIFQDFIASLRKSEKHRDKDKTKHGYMSLLKEFKLSRVTHWSDAKKKIEADPRYKAVESAAKREEWFKDFLKKHKGSRETSEARRDREKKDRQEASIRDREREVRESLSSALRDRDKERDYHLRCEAEQTFMVMLTDIVRSSDDSWKDVKRVLKKEQRWDDISARMDRSRRDNIFKDHIAALRRKSKRK